jgi:RimJ/RimL family protein N-acetyltransferase
MRLRPVDHDDIGWLVAMAGDPVLVGEHNWPGTAVDLDERVREMTARLDADGMIGEQKGTMVVELDDGTPIGDVSWRTEHWGPSDKSRCPAFGIALLPEHRGKGYGTVAQRLLVDYLFANTSTNRIQSDTAIDNPAEQRALEKIGMMREGVVRQAEYRNGQYHDHVLYSILRSEWSG